MKKNRIITVQDIPITVTYTDMEDYICITDMAAVKKRRFESSRYCEKLVKKPEYIRIFRDLGTDL